MISRRKLAALLGTMLLLVDAGARAAAPQDSAIAQIRGFYDTLLAVMKEGKQLGFAGRRDKLAPTIRHVFDFPLMTRLMVGPQWQGLTADQQKQLIAAFSAFSIATYANRFDDYSGEHFDVDDETKPSGSNGEEIVSSRLVPTKGDSVELDYLMRLDSGIWQVIDVYLSGTVSELATRRSEFTSVMRRGGAAALVELLQKKVAELSG